MGSRANNELSWSWNARKVEEWARPLPVRKLEQGSLTEAIKYQQLHGGARKHSSLMGVQPGLLSSETRGGEESSLAFLGLCHKHRARWKSHYSQRWKPQLEKTVNKLVRRWEPAGFTTELLQGQRYARLHKKLILLETSLQSKIANWGGREPLWERLQTASMGEIIYALSLLTQGLQIIVW